MFQLTVEARFNATHRLALPDGTFEPNHGHDWRVATIVAADRLDDMETVMDFHELERVLGELLRPLNHTDLNAHPAFAEANPSAERLAEWIGRSLKPQLPDHVRLVRVDVEEAPRCIASFVPDA